MLKQFLFKRPDWFKHEGYWRLAQVLRLGPTFTFLAFSVIFFGGWIFMISNGEREGENASVIALAWLAGAVAYIVAMHWLVRLVVWIAEGFKSGSKAAR
ncbi:hypothetical protein [Pseudomonas fluorescens]|uniref:hypothetical protein n=1 Tax=Pseudomonas fluorescens TaxID=294 RepID=UPI001241A18B|nr:hypothetical protein [Pseudomonas fluorescens]